MKLEVNLFPELDAALDKIIDTIPIDTSHIPKLLSEFVTQYQQTINGKPRNNDLYPFFDAIYAEDSPEVYVTCGRQLGKSTLASSILAHRALLFPNSTHMALLDNQARASVFSEIKIRQNTFLSNPDLAYTLVEGGSSNLARTRLYNKSAILVYTCFNNYRNSEGNDSRTIIFDEFSHHEGDIAIPKFTTTAFPDSKIWYFSIGGDDSGMAAGIWRDSTQNEWEYEDKSDYIDTSGHKWAKQGWRKNLSFDESGINNNSKSELKQYLVGSWVESNPDADIVGYHIPMTVSPIVPLSESDAKAIYNTSISKSIQYMKRHYAPALFSAHTMGEWYRSATRGLSRTEFEKTYQPKLSLLTPQQIAQIVSQDPDRWYSFAGIDWGSNLIRGRTVLSICLYDRLNKRLRLALIDKPAGLSYENQVKRFLDIIITANCNYTVADLGFGSVQCELMKKELRSKFEPCVTSGNLITEGQEIDRDSDRSKKIRSHLTVNKTKIIDDMIHEIQTTFPDPLHPDDESLYKSSFQVPTGTFDDVYFLIDDFTSLTMKSISTDEEVNKPNPSQSPRREWNHIPDLVASVIYCMIARDNHRGDTMSIYPVRRTGTGVRFNR